MAAQFRRSIRAGDERGSIILAALMFTFILTLLGIAVFDLATLDARLALGNEADYRALELAQSAAERTLHQLFLDLCGGASACTSPPLDGSWADGSINGATYTVCAASPCTFQDVSTWGTSTTPLTDFGDPSTFGGVTTTQSYFVQVMNIVTKKLPSDPPNDDASKLGLTCTSNDAALPLCTDAIRVRITTATFRAGVGTSTRTLELVAKATLNGLLGDGILAGAPSAGTIQGNSRLHGSLHIVGCSSGPCAQLSFTGNTGIFNNYDSGSKTLPANLQNYVPLLPTIVCPVSTACAGLKVETLAASVRVAKPDDNTLHLGGAADVGEPGSGNTNSVTGNVGKPTMEGVYLGNGCQTATCSDQVDNPGHVYTDKPIRAYDVAPAPTFPALSDAVTILNLPYSNYAACSGPGACNSNGAAVGGGGGNDFFISHAMQVTSTTQSDGSYQYATSWAPATQGLLNLLSSGSWTDTTPNFSFTFTCGAGGVTCDDANGNRVNGHICTAGGDCTASKADGYQVEWDQGTSTVSVYKCPTGQPVPCGVPAPTGTIAAGNIPNDTSFRYRMTYVDSGGNEFAISPVVNVTTPHSPSASRVTFSVPAGPSGTATRNLYRFYGGGGDKKYHLVAFISGNAPGTLVDNLSPTSLGGSCTLEPSASPCTPSGALLREGLLSDSSLPTNPVLIYVDDRLKICDGCTGSANSIFFRGNALFLAKGNTADTPASSTGSISIDTNLLPACAGTCPANGAFPRLNTFLFYTPGNIFMGSSSQRNFVGGFYAGGKWSTAKQTNLLGGVAAQVFDMGSQVPSFWQVKMPPTPTTFPPRSQRWSVASWRWKMCTPADPTPCL